MILVVGLGNPGKQYEKTRHNAGFMVLNELKKQELPGVRLLKPNTFMNESGAEVKKKIKNSKNLIVIHDDIDIPLGEIKISINRGSAGHKGVESIIRALGTKNFTRVRVGILPSTGKPADVENFVLKKFLPAELPLLKNAIEQACAAVQELIAK